MHYKVYAVIFLIYEIKDEYLKKMARRTRLELATPCVTGRYSNQLNYRRTVKNGGRYKTRTCDIYLVRVALYQLS